MSLVDRAPRPTPSWIIAIILVVAALHWMQVLALPMAFSLFLMALVSRSSCLSAAYSQSVATQSEIVHYIRRIFPTADDDTRLVTVEIALPGHPADG